MDAMKNRGVKPIAVNSIPGQVEQKLERLAAVWRRRCEGATMTSLAMLNLPKKGILSGGAAPFIFSGECGPS
jgi:hypothetical protein